MNNVRDMGIERILEDMRSFLTDPSMGEPTAASLDALRGLLHAVVTHRYETLEDGLPVAVEVFDARREMVRIIRMPHPQRIRDAHTPEGASLSEAMESLELIALTACDAVRSIAGEIAAQETERERRARHIARCVPVRIWGESLAQTAPHLSRMLISFASDGQAPRLIEADDARRLGFDPRAFQELLDPERIEDLTECLVQMARSRIVGQS